MSITNKSLYKKITDLCDIFIKRQTKESWLNRDCSWIKRTDEKDKADCLVIIVRGDCMKRAEKSLDYICNLDKE